MFAALSSHRLTLCVMPAVFAVYIPMCTPQVAPTAPPWHAQMAQLWEKPLELQARDLYNGPWGPERAPDPRASEPPRAVAAPRLYSGGGGAPIPNAGFLGFDGGRSVQ